MDVSIREMTLADLYDVLEIEKNSFPTPWSLRAFVAELTDNEHARYLVACVEDRVVGYGGYWIILDEAHVTNIAVHPGYRGFKIGNRILVELMKGAARDGAKRMTLEVRQSNKPAQKLYEKMGFIRQGIRKGYYTDTGEDAYIMCQDNLVEFLERKAGEGDYTQTGSPVESR